MSQNPQPLQKEKDTVAVTIVIATAVVVLACIGACAGVMLTFLLNAPW